MIRRNPDGTLDEFSVVHSLVGGAITGSRKNGKSNFTFHDGQTPPSEKEIDAEIKRLNEEYEKQAYARSRAVSYDPIPEQLDQIFHDIEGWKKRIKSVKEKFPKP